MTTQNSLSPVPVLTHAGNPIPKMGTIAYHDSIGFAEVVGRVGNRVRIAITDFSDASDVTLQRPMVEDGESLNVQTGAVVSVFRNPATTETISRKAWLKRLADSSDEAALIECTVYEARAQNETDGLYGATALVRQLQESRISRTRRSNEMLVSIDNAEAFGWEFDEYATYTPKRKITKGKAPAPRPQKQEPSRVGTLEDPSRPDWLVAEMNECFGNTWTPNAEE